VHSNEDQVRPAAEAQNSSARRVIVVLAATMTVCVVSLMIAGVASLVSLADRIHPVAGTIVFWGVCLTTGLVALYYAIAYTRLPPTLGPPEEESGPKYDAYLEALRARLAANPRTRDLPVITKEEIEKAIGHAICLSLQRKRLKRRLGTFQLKRIWSSAGQQARSFSARR